MVKHHNSLILLVPEAGFEPARSNRPRDFKSLASTNSATPACLILKNILPQVKLP
jgi:hypothetical protein